MKLLVLLDISESMGYSGKRESAVESVIRASREALEEGREVALLAFESFTELVASFSVHSVDELHSLMEEVPLRGVTCLSYALEEAKKLLQEAGGAEVLLVTDGRPNVNLARTGGFEGDVKLEEEALKLAKELGVKVHCVAVGEDAFTHTLNALSKATGGIYSLAETFRGLVSPPRSIGTVEVVDELEVRGVPLELPYSQPTWVRESQTLHLAVVSEDIYERYVETRLAFLVNPANGREARIALISIEDQRLKPYVERRPKTAEKVRRGGAILLDRSYRDFLGLEKKGKIRLEIRALS